RRRHTRFSRDWSSDVCSSDLLAPMIATDRPLIAAMQAVGADANVTMLVNVAGLVALAASFFSVLYAFSRQLFALSRAGYLPKIRSEERRVGKEGRVSCESCES